MLRVDLLFLDVVFALFWSKPPRQGQVIRRLRYVGTKKSTEASKAIRETQNIRMIMIIPWVLLQANSGPAHDQKGIYVDGIGVDTKRTKVGASLADEVS